MLAKSALESHALSGPGAPGLTEGGLGGMAWLLGHLCQDRGVLRKPHKTGATELGGTVPFRLHIGLRLKTQLSDFRTFHSSKNNCTWGKHADTSRRHLVASTVCQKLLELTGSVCHAPTVPTLPALRPVAPGSRHQVLGTRDTPRTAFVWPGRALIQNHTLP